jgi:hypothetical protein
MRTEHDMRRPGFSTIDAQNWRYEHDEDGTDPDDARDDAVDRECEEAGLYE